MPEIFVTNWKGEVGVSFNFTETIPEGMILAEFQPPSVLLVYTIICLGVDDNHICRDSLSALARYAGMNTTTIALAVDTLEERGLIKVLDREHTKNYNGVTIKTKWQVFKRDGYICQYCGTDNGPFAADHIVPTDKGGSNAMSNLTTACYPCNRHKSNKNAEDFRNE